MAETMRLLLLAMLGVSTHVWAKGLTVHHVVDSSKSDALVLWPQSTALAWLEGLGDTPLHVVSVVGAYHTGKSFLGTMLANASCGFAVGPTTDPATQGLWLSAPVFFTVPGQAESVSVLLLDTEGLRVPSHIEAGRRGLHDAKVFALAVLLSSHVIYNVHHNIDAGDIEDLDLLARRARLFQLNASAAPRPSTMKAFPAMTWVVRDFFQEPAGGKSASQWLRDLLEKDARSKDPGIASLLDIFGEPHCQPLGLPVTNSSLLRRLDKLPDGEHLQPTFLEGVNRLQGHIASMLSGQDMIHHARTGPQLAHLLRVLVEAANSDALQQVESYLALYMDKQRHAAARLAKTQFFTAAQRLIHHQLPLDRTEFGHGVTAARNACLLEYAATLFRLSPQATAGSLPGTPGMGELPMELDQLLQLAWAHYDERVVHQALALRQALEANLTQLFFNRSQTELLSTHAKDMQQAKAARTEAREVFSSQIQPLYGDRAIPYRQQLSLLEDMLQAILHQFWQWRRQAAMASTADLRSCLIANATDELYRLPLPMSTVAVKAVVLARAEQAQQRLATHVRTVFGSIADGQSALQLLQGALEQAGQELLRNNSHAVRSLAEPVLARALKQARAQLGRSETLWEHLDFHFEARCTALAEPALQRILPNKPELVSEILQEWRLDLVHGPLATSSVVRSSTIILTGFLCVLVVLALARWRPGAPRNVR